MVRDTTVEGKGWRGRREDDDENGRSIAQDAADAG